MKIPTLSVAHKHGYFNIILGIAFLLTIAIDLFTDNTFKSICAIFSCICFILAIFSHILSKEPDDERSIQNLNNAGHDAFKIVIILLLSITLLQKTSLTLPFVYTIELLIAIGYIAYGTLFLYYEKED